MTNRQFLNTLSDNELARQLLSKVNEITTEVECNSEFEDLDMIDLYEQKQELLEKWLSEAIMNEEDKLNKAIQQYGVNTQSEILDELKCQYPQYAEQFANSDISHKKE